MIAESKFDIGDTLYYMDNNEINEFVVDSIQIDMTSKDKVIVHYYNDTYDHHLEDGMFATKDELLDELAKRSEQNPAKSKRKVSKRK